MFSLKSRLKNTQNHYVAQGHVFFALDFCPGFFSGAKTEIQLLPRIFVEKSEAKYCPGFLPYAIIKGFRPNCSYKHFVEGFYAKKA